MSILALFQKEKKSVNIGFIDTADEFDVQFLDSESHDWPVSVTRYPVEAGSPITDHIRPEPRRVVISGMASDAPVTVIESVSGLFSSESKVQSAIEYLRKLRNQRALVSLATKHETYPSMAVSGIKLQRGRDTGDKLPYEITFSEVTIARSNEINASFAAVDSVKAPVRQGAGSATSDLGKKSASVANEAEQAKGSVAYQLAQGLGVL
jgi:hypothetical protein